MAPSVSGPAAGGVRRKVYDAGMTELVGVELPGREGPPPGCGHQVLDCAEHVSPAAGMKMAGYPSSSSSAATAARARDPGGTGVHGSRFLLCPSRLPCPPHLSGRGLALGKPQAARQARLGQLQIRDKIVIVSPALKLSTSRARLVYRFIYVSRR